MRTRISQAVALLLPAVLVVAACSGDDDDSSGNDPAVTSAEPADTTGDTGDTEATTAPTEPGTSQPADGTSGSIAPSDDECTEERKGGSVTFGTVNPTGVLDPATSLGTGATGGIQTIAIWDTLLRYDETVEDYVPHVAESVEANEDFTQWTIKLREGVEFGNGDPLTADIVIASVERLRESTTQKSDLVRLIESSEAVDELTAVFTLTEPFAQFRFAMASEPGMIVNTNLIDPASDEPFNPQPGQGAGLGPFEISRYVPNEELVLTPKDNYWGGPVCLDELRFVHIAGGRGTYDAFKTGEIQMGIFDDPEVVAEARADGVEGPSSLLGGRRLLVMNQSEGAITTDVRIRKALAHAINYDVLNERLAPGTGLASATIVPENSPLFSGTEGLPYDPELAQQLVEEAKADGWDGTLEFITADEPFLVETTLVLEGMFEAVGIDIDLQQMPLAEEAPRVIGLDYEIAMWGAWVSEPSPWSAFSSYASDSGRTRTAFQNEQMDALLEDMKLAETLEDAKVVMSGIQELWNEEVPSIPVFGGEFFFPTDPALKGVVETLEAVVMFHDAYLEQ